ncbi:MAG: redoxin domain-containing protein [Victivallaceae bacterium]|nr:redoxin domain-containing protein [Victivallaceae bacterium]
MKKLLLVCGLIGFVMFNSFALQVGNTAPRLDVDKWLKNGPASIIMKATEDDSVKPCRAVVFWGTWNPNLKNDILTLNYLQHRYRKQGLQIIAVSREPVKQIKKALKVFPVNYAIAADRDSRTTLQYMGDDHVFPKIFLVNQQREIIWKGEIADLENILKKFFKGNFDVNRQVTIDKMHNKLRLTLRSFNTQDAEKIINNILRDDPTDGFAIRAAMFIYEKSNRPATAIAFIDKRIAAVKDDINLRLMKLRLMQQYSPDKTTEINTFAKQALKDFSEQPEALNDLAWFLLNGFPFTPDIILTALKAAQNAAAKTVDDKDVEKKAIINTTLARAYCIIGNPKQALKLQEQLSLTITNQQQKKQSLKYEKYYRQLVKLRKRKIMQN